MRNAREIAIRFLATGPCQSLLQLVGKSRAGFRLLNVMSGDCRLFRSFEEAWKSAGRNAYAGHDHPDYIREHLDLSKSLRPSDYAVLYWLLRINPDNLRVFDFAGNVGNLFYSYYPYLRRAGELVDWTVFDLPRTIEKGREIAANRSAPGLSFEDSVRGFSEEQTLLVSGAFHYWETSVREFLRQFPQRPHHVIVNRTPVHDSQPPFITVQHRGSYAVPCIVRNMKELASAFAAEGYVMVDQWPAFELSLRMPLLPNYTVPYYSGFYFRQQA
jgi:putative methyltransferase (TIGR04325 family)